MIQDIPFDLATSPLTYDSDFMERGIRELHKEADSNSEEVKVTGDSEVMVTITDTTIAIDDNVESVQNDTGENKTIDMSQEHVVHIESTKIEVTGNIEELNQKDVTLRTENETKDEPWKTKKKRRRKRKNMPTVSNKVKSEAGNSPVPGDAGEDEIFEMEDISSDEELARLTAGMSKSISLPAVEESKLDRTTDWASAHESFYLNPHPFSDTDLSPLGR